MGSPTVQRYDEAEFDTPAGAAGSRSLTYVVCSSQRSGSGLLCRGLGESGVAGRPTEYFYSELRRMLSERWGCGRSLEEYAATVRARRTSPAGVLGTKLHWYQLEELRAESRAPDDLALIERLLGARPVFVHISRRDVDRQAVSLWTAMHTGVWARRAAEAGAEAVVPYDLDGILECRRRSVLEEQGWQRFFSAHEIEPVEVVYEELSTSYRATLQAVLDRLAPGHRATIAEPLSVRLADARSEELLERFRRDRLGHVAA